MQTNFKIAHIVHLNSGSPDLKIVSAGWRRAQLCASLRNHMPTRQDRSAQPEANPANFKDLLWPRYPIM
jgi:hypothetical protein